MANQPQDKLNQEQPRSERARYVADELRSQGGLSRRLLLFAASAGGTMLATGTLITQCGCCDEPEHQDSVATGSSGLGGEGDAQAGELGSLDPDLDADLGANRFDAPLEPTHDPEVAARQRAIEKAQDFDSSFHDDVVVIDERMQLLRRVQKRINRAQGVVGHGHFGLFGFDDLIAAGERFAGIGRFEKEEKEFLEELFSVDAADYGFFGEKVIDRLTYRHKRSETQRTRGTGHALIKGQSLQVFQQMREDVPSLVLTSGVRGVAKQYQLFLTKVVATEGNLSRAARSLAPPGYSHHGTGDFDVGAASLGQENFTEEFARTNEYSKLMELGYVEIRYDMANQLGVRHEPWHIRAS